MQIARELAEHGKGLKSSHTTTSPEVPARARSYPLALLAQLPADLARKHVLNTAEAAGFCKLSIPHWRRLYRTGKVPRPVRLSARKYGWRLGDLVDFIDAGTMGP